MTRTLLHGGPVFTGSEVLPAGAVVLQDDRIDWVGAAADAPAEREEAIDLRGRLVTPGWINSHTHIYSALARGLALKDPPPENFVQILERLWWRLDRALSLEEIALSAKLHAWESLRAGVTTIFDHHASQQNVRGSLETLSGALEEIGLRACLCFEVSDRRGPEIAAAGIEENMAFLASCASRPDPRRRGLFGLHAAFTITEPTLKRCVAAARDLEAGFHLHLAEDFVDAEGVVARLDSAGVLGPKTLCVHGVRLGDAELGLLAERRCWLAHCPESNLHNAVGVLRLSRARRAGLRLALGTDGFTTQICREALVGHLAQNHLSGDSNEGWRTMPSLLLSGNPELAGEVFGVPLGVLRAGAAADLVVWDYRPPTPIPTGSFWGHLLFGLLAARAEEVWIDGRRVLSGGSLPGRDEEELIARCRSAARDLWERF